MVVANSRICTVSSGYPEIHEFATALTQMELRTNGMPDGITNKRNARWNHEQTEYQMELRTNGISDGITNKRNTRWNYELCVIASKVSYL